MTTSPSDFSIPVLTEILAPAFKDSPPEPENNRPLVAPPAPAPVVAPPLPPLIAMPVAAPEPVETAPVSTTTLAAQAAADWSEEEWNRLERKVRERILRQVLGRIDFVLEQRVRDSLADVLQMAVENIAVEIKRGLHQTLGDVISRAVSQEIARMQTTKK